MSKFGKYAIVEVTTYNLKLEPQWYWKIKSPTAREDLKMQNFFSNPPQMTLPDGRIVNAMISNLDVTLFELGLLFAGTNIPKGDTPVEEGGEPLCKVGDSIETIVEALKDLPTDMIVEIWTAIGECTTGYGPTKANPT
jgi:hypothetical protein